ncbi:nucleotidyl transferase AbiEii/AbiGii toxin family protein [Aquincola tertiaricarbonis]|uniref:nucleotidyl transferase AbiEii/AbiGii toxin family protein n=1 Tax=Aquincola tertiaricarbonis TaxID=391953 RepID=UPI0035C0B04F
MRARAIREDNGYGGTRISLIGRVSSARCALQIDIAFGDAVTPAPQRLRYPCLLAEIASPVLRHRSHLRAPSDAATRRTTRGTDRGVQRRRRQEAPVARVSQQEPGRGRGTR